MAHRGQTGTSLGGRIVRRKDLKPKPEAPPVDPSALSPEALARREEYRRDESARQEAARQTAAKAKEQADLRDAGSGKRVMNAGDALRRHR
jgi:hypothetical protein